MLILSVTVGLAGVTAICAVGTWLTGKLTAFEVPPPGVALITVMLPLPGAAISVCEIVARNCVALTNVVVRLLPFHCTVEPLINPVPFTVSVNCVLVAKTLVGASVVIAGTGLLTASDKAFDSPPPGTGFTAVMLTVPAV